MAGKKDDRPQGPASLPPRKPSLRELFGDGPAPTDVSDTAGPAAPLGTPGGAPERAAPSETASEDGPHPELDFDVFLQRAQTKQKY